MSGARAKVAVAIVCVALAGLLARSGGADPATDPGAQPIPLPDLDPESKAVVAILNFTGDAEAEMTSAEVVFGRASGKAGNPPLLRVELRDYRGLFLEQYDEWDPRWVFAETEAAGESLHVVPEAAGRFVIPFDPDLKTMEVFNLRADMVVGSFDLGPAIRAFCESHPMDPDCEIADLEVADVEIIDPPPLVLVGDSQSITLEVVIGNNGPDEPMDAAIEVAAAADPGLSVTPAVEMITEPALGLNEQRTLARSYAVECLEPGLHGVTFTAVIDALKPAVSDPDPTNNEAEVDLDVDCAVPVTINIKPGGDPNSINRKGADIPVAVLTTEAGEYGNPLGFDATTIDPQRARFGPFGVASVGGGAHEIHSVGHIENAFELDEKTRDDDLDMVLHFLPAAANFSQGDAEGCVKGKFDGGGGMVFTFFGCGPVAIVK